MRLGKLPPKYRRDILRLGPLLDEPALRTPPPLINPPAIEQWGMYGNDVHADCTCAAAAHMIVGWRGFEHTAAAAPTDADVLSLYARVNGGEDSGAYAIDVLHQWHNEGLGADKIAAFVKVDQHQTDHVRQALWQFGGLYTGFNLPRSAQAQGAGTWDVVPSLNMQGPAIPGSWGGHAVNAIGYNPVGPMVVTWGRLQQLTWAFWDAYCDEAYAVFDTLDWLGDVPGFKADELVAALAHAW